MRPRRRINWIVVAICAGVVFIGILLFSSREGPDATANDFLAALAHGNVKRLMDLSYYQGDPKKLEGEWKFATQVAGAHYTFTWRTIQSKTSDQAANVIIMITKNPVKLGSYEEQSAIPLVWHNNRWMVDVKSLDPSLYPDLPR